MTESTRKDRLMVKGILVCFAGLGGCLVAHTRLEASLCAMLGALGFWLLLESLQ